MNVEFVDWIAKRKTQGNFRQLTTPVGLIDFSSNDALGLARSEDFKRAALKNWNDNALVLNGLGSTGSRLLTGNTKFCETLEEEIAAFHGYEAGLLFNCGYMANIGLFSAICKENDIILYDSKIHASTFDGIRLSPARGFPFRHNDLSHLQKKLSHRSHSQTCYICVESLYSTDGSMAPLKGICQLAREYNALVVVDEAHAVGTLGPQGRGLVAEHKLCSEIFAQIITFGKSLAAHGAMILGSRLLREILINFAPSFIYTTALPQLMLSAIRTSYTIFPGMATERQHIQHLINIFRTHYPQGTPSHIQSIAVGDCIKIKHISQRLAQQGFDVRPLTSPTVKRGDERLRICLHAFNRESELVQLLNAIKREIVQ